jgi:hypothetical protein
MAWTAQVRFLTVQDFSFLHSVQTDSEAHPASYTTGTGGGIYPVVKWQERETDHSPSSGATIKKDGAIPPLPHLSSWYSA